MYGHYDNVRIAGIQAAVPSRYADNIEVSEKMGSRRAKKIVEYTGVKRRHLCIPGQRASDLSAIAAGSLLDYLGWKRDEIRVLVNVTQSADLRVPATAMIIQKRLGIGKECIAFDVNLGCTGYASGIQIVAALLQNTGGKGLLLVGDGMYYGEPEQFGPDLLIFGDGSAATAIELVNGFEMYYSQNTDGNRYELLYSPWTGGYVMDGNAIMLLALNEASTSISNLMKLYSIPESSINYYFFHQAQRLILDGMIDQCGIDADKVLRSYQEYGNTSTATIPLTISLYSNLLKEKDRIRILVSGFGVGLAWNAMILDLDTDGLLPIIETDHVFGDIPQ